jgi:hypothetical protein
MPYGGGEGLTRQTSDNCIHTRPLGKPKASDLALMSFIAGAVPTP